MHRNRPQERSPDDLDIRGAALQVTLIQRELGAIGIGQDSHPVTDGFDLAQVSALIGCRSLSIFLEKANDDKASQRNAFLDKLSSGFQKDIADTESDENTARMFSGTRRLSLKTGCGFSGS